MNKLNDDRAEEARNLLEKWLILVKKRAYRKMTDLVQITWAYSQSKREMTDFIRTIYKDFKIKKYKYISHKTTAAMVTFEYEITTQYGPRKMMANVIIESGPYKPDPVNGTFGINPISAMLKK